MSVLELLKASTIISESNSIKLAAGFTPNLYETARECLALCGAKFDPKTQTHQFEVEIKVTDGLAHCLRFVAGMDKEGKMPKLPSRKHQKAVLEFVEGMAPKAGSGISSVTIQVQGHEPVVLTPETRVKAKAKLEELKQTGFQPEPTPALEAVTGIRLIALEQIIAVESVQSRAQLDMIAVAEYAAALEPFQNDGEFSTDGLDAMLRDAKANMAALKLADNLEDVAASVRRSIAWVKS